MVTLGDSSVWIDFLRASGSAAAEYVRQLLDSQEPVPVEPAVDYRAAAALYRECRQLGRTIRSLNHSLVAGIALRTEATLAHKYADLDVIAEISGLDAVSLR